MAELMWERIADPLDSRKTVWWRGTWPGCGPAYLSVALRGCAYVWAVRRRPGPDHVAAEGRAATLATARNQAGRARVNDPGTNRCAGCGLGFRGARGLRAHQAGRHVAAGCRPRSVADMSAIIGGMVMNTHERAKAANAALTPEQRSAAGRARAAQLHHPTTLARRIGKAWPELSDEDRKAVRRELRAAGIIT